MLAGDAGGGDLSARQHADIAVFSLGAGRREFGEGDEGVGRVQSNTDQIDLRGFCHLDERSALSGWAAKNFRFRSVSTTALFGNQISMRQVERLLNSSSISPIHFPPAETIKSRGKYYTATAIASRFDPKTFPMRRICAPTPRSFSSMCS